MAFVLTVANPKGGSGKSTTVCNMAAMFTSIGYATAVAETDTDGDQFSSANWVMTRRASNLPQVRLVMISSGEDVRHAIHSLRSDPTVDVVIVDVSGRDSVINRAALLESDAWLVPVKPTQNDLARVPYIQSMAERLMIERPEMIIHLFINEAPTNNRIEEREARNFIRELGIEPTVTSIKARKAYRDCIKEGMGVMDLPGNTGRKAADEFSEFFTELMQDYQPILEYRLNDIGTMLESKAKKVSGEVHHGGI